MTKATGYRNFMGGVCDERGAGWEANYTVPFYRELYSYIVSCYIGYIVSCYIRTKHNVDYALHYRLTRYSYIKSTYISAVHYMGGGVSGGACLALSFFRFIALRLYAAPPLPSSFLTSLLNLRRLKGHNKPHCPPPPAFLS